MNKIHWHDVRDASLDKDSRIRNEVFVKLIGTLVMTRKKLNLSQSVIAERVGITQPNLAKIENGDSIPKIDTFYKIASALDLEIVLTSTRRIPE